MKAHVVEHEEEEGSEEVKAVWCPEGVKYDYNDHMALAARTFWRDPVKAKAQFDQSNNSSGKKDNGPRMRTCYNCQDRFHFVAECPFEKREDHGGKLIPKDKSKVPRKKPFAKKNTTNKKPSRIVLLTQEQYSSGEEEEEEQETPSGVASIATTSTPPSSLFDSPNENLPNKNINCFMARASEVSSSTTFISKTKNAKMDDLASLKAKEEVVALDFFYV